MSDEQETLITISSAVGQVTVQDDGGDIDDVEEKAYNAIEKCEELHKEYMIDHDSNGMHR